MIAQLFWEVEWFGPLTLGQPRRLDDSFRSNWPCEFGP